MTDEPDPTAGTLFEPERDGRWTATELSRGPWDPRACHGGPVAALVVRELERADDQPDDPTWQLARMTIELTRPVPVRRPLDVDTVVERPGRKVSLVSSTLRDDGSIVATARGLRIRRTALELPSDTVEPDDDPPGTPDQGDLATPPWADTDPIAFHTHACEHRVTEGSWAEPGPTAVWMHLGRDVVPGERPSGVQRVAATADFGNGVSAALDKERFLFINPDLTVHLGRPPVGDWIALRAATHYGSRMGTVGAAFAESAIYDERGRLGRSVQSLLVEPR